MTPADDCVDGMGTPLLDDDAIEAFFLGTDKSAWEQDQALLMLAEGVRVAVGGPPPRPHGALLAFADDAAPAVSVAPSLVVVPNVFPAAEAPTGRRHIRHLLSGRLRRPASVAAGIGIAAAALTVAGTTGVLPDPVMRTIVRVVEAATPFELSEPTKPPASTVPGPQSAATVPATPTAGPSVPANSVAGSGRISDGGATQQPSVNTPAGSRAAAPPAVPGPVQPGTTGVDRAGQTPAGAFIPPFVPGRPAGPAPATPGYSAPPSSGVDRAAETPAAGSIPPVAGSPPGRR